MLNLNNPAEEKELEQIIDTACGVMFERGVPEFQLVGVNWDSRDNSWVVSFYSDYGNNEYTHVCLGSSLKEVESGGYITVGFYHKGNVSSGWELPGIPES